MCSVTGEFCNNFACILCSGATTPFLCTGAINGEGHIHFASVKHPVATLLTIKGQAGGILENTVNLLCFISST